MTIELVTIVLSALGSTAYISWHVSWRFGRIEAEMRVLNYRLTRLEKGVPPTDLVIDT